MVLTVERMIRDNHHENLQYNNLHNWQVEQGTESAGMKGMRAVEQGYRRGK
jgi:TPP-dependent 2-oxoacid decarboxylase